ncbi:hypothetical protein [Thiothrix subterranea]|uniref:Uncharacterized protein n=1 Tax=Thiothrix subterranea TaxID=2735563 RepID=A0AA51R1X7_9GAMM|nr:hypothetical protein [Thiothrix subterranea]MDQ5770833.1 hypothetical protein [Thiothrix subterranea]WML87249.1 hypothetical protein RCG00_02560 [Thiothrix subterranea]
MPALTVNLTSEEFDLLTTKAGKHDLSEIVKIALDEYFSTHRFVETNTVPLDLSGSGKAIAALEADRIDLNKPLPPNRYERRFDNNRLRFETDEDFEKAMSAYRWRLDLYEAEKATFERKRSAGNINEWGGVSCVL